LANYRAEYEQANELFRHYQKTQWATLPIIITAFSVLVLTWEVGELSFVVFLGSISIVLCVSWFYISRRYQAKIRIISERIDELEDILGMHLHSQIRERERRRAEELVRTVLSEGFYVVHIASILLVILWIVRIVLAFNAQDI